MPDIVTTEARLEHGNIAQVGACSKLLTAYEELLFIHFKFHASVDIKDVDCEAPVFILDLRAGFLEVAHVLKLAANNIWILLLQELSKLEPISFW